MSDYALLTWKNFRYATLITAILAAVITPTPDAIAMLVLMAPMIVVYLYVR